MNEIIKKYKNNGYVAIRIFSKEEYKIIEDYSLRWFYKLAGIAKKEWDLFPIEKYHHWSKKLKINHEEMAGFKFRYRKPSSEVNKLLTSNIKLCSFFKKIGVSKYKVWDDGLGYLGFRIIRPNSNDGFPLHKKEWGVAKNLISIWIPIIGKNPRETFSLISKSNKSNYKYYFPKTSKFKNSDGRLIKSEENKVKITNPNLLNNEVVIYSPKTLHSEKNIKSKDTRYNLEIRFNDLSLK